jgi:hypothetical protein
VRFKLNKPVLLSPVPFDKSRFWDIPVGLVRQIDFSVGPGLAQPYSHILGKKGLAWKREADDFLNSILS